MDVTPTILQLFGLPTGLDMDGRPLAGAWEQPPEVEFIDSWENIPGEDGRHQQDADQQIDPADQEEAIAQLVELGYIDRPDEDQAVAVGNTVRELRYNLARDYIGCRLSGEAIEILEELWQKFPDESRFGVKIVESQIALGEAEKARQTLDKVRSEKQRYALEAREQLKALQEEDKENERKPEDMAEGERRKRRSLMLKAGVNPHAFAYLEGRVAAAGGEHEKALAAYEHAAEVQSPTGPASIRPRATRCCICAAGPRRRSVSAPFWRSTRSTPAPSSASPARSSDAAGMRKRGRRGWPPWGWCIRTPWRTSCSPG